MEEQATEADPLRIKSVYERAVANTPPSTQDKRLWKRYVYLYLNYAVYLEQNGEDAVKTYQDILRKIPH